MTYTHHSTIVFQGNLGSAPERRESKQQVGYYILNVAQSIYKGEDQPTETNWFKCLVWEPSRSAKIIPHLSKGSKVIITGSLGKAVPFINKNGEASVTLNVSVLNISSFGSPKKEENSPAEEENSPAEEENEYPPF